MHKHRANSQKDMNNLEWSKSDYAIGLDFITQNEEQAKASTLLDAGSELTVALPTGLPLYGMGLYSAFILAPILLFILIVTYFLVAYLFSGHGTTATLFMVISGCLFMLWGLGKVLQLLFSVRELFTRKFFATLGKKGVAMHFSRWHFPLQCQTAIAWNDVESTQVTTTLFIPGLLVGIPRTTIFQITAKNGELLKIPFHPKKDGAQSVIEAIGRQIQSLSGTSVQRPEK